MSTAAGVAGTADGLRVLAKSSCHRTRPDAEALEKGRRRYHEGHEPLDPTVSDEEARDPEARDVTATGALMSLRR
jgi:hypothetical protein